MVMINRRNVIKAGLATSLISSFPSLCLAANPTGQKLHGLSAFGQLKYTADFKNFDYANSQAPTGGVFRFQPGNWRLNQNTSTFNTLNSFVLKGEAPPRMELCFDTLMVAALDEPDAIYCALAETVEMASNRNDFLFTLRGEAKFSDGTPLTAEDVAWSFNTIKKDGHPQLSLALINLVEAVAISAREVELRFNGKQTDHAILAVASEVPILSQAWYKTRNFNTSSMEAPLGSGPYKVGRFAADKFIEYDKREDYWGRDLPFMRGLWHFQTIRIDFFRDRTAAFESFKKGEIEFREEFTSRGWANDYNFPAVLQGKVKLEQIPTEKHPSMQGWAINSRHAKFSDPRTRQAIDLCFDFEWTNKNLFYGAYTRSQSIFENSDFKAVGMPDAAELAILNEWKDKISPQAFGEALLQPVSDASGNNRAQLRKAVALLAEAGWKRDGNILKDAKDKVFKLEFLIDTPSLETLHGKFVENLKSVGIDASIRLVDASQYQSRIETFDFDIIMVASSLAATPSREGLQQMMLSEYAGRDGSQNYPAIRMEAIDGLLERLAGVKTRAELVTLLRVVDRVLRLTYLWIPNWYAANHRLAYWNIYGRGDVKPDYGYPEEQLWWYDAEKAKAIGRS